MAYGIIGYQDTGALPQPSGSVWGDCPAQELLDEGTGFFDYNTFVDDGTLPGQPSSAANSGTFTQDANFDHALLITTGATSGNGAIIYDRPTSIIAPGTGQKLWMEALIGVPAIPTNGTNNEGIFVGFVNKVGLTNALIKASSVTAASNLLTSVSGTSLVGFWSHGDVMNNFDAVWVNAVSGTGGLQPATGTGTAAQKVNTVLANVLTQPTTTSYPNAQNPLGYAASTFNLLPPPGVLVSNGTTIPGTYTANTVATPGFVKLGLRYDGQQYLYFYVNGSQVAKMVISSTFDITDTFAPVVAITTGSANAQTMDVGFFRAASKVY